MLEAIALLIVARWLVGHVRFGRWRALLGARVSDGRASDDTTPADQGRAHRLAQVVERAAARLPGESKCLPRAIALQWLLRRRRLGGMLTIGVRAGQARGHLNDLHAWVARGDEVLIGDHDRPHGALYVALNPAPVTASPGGPRRRSRPT